MKNILIYITDRYKRSGQRSQLLIKNIAASFVIKGWSLVVQLLLVPIALNCLTVYEYGLWLTLNSILMWTDNLDIGLGNGLRNKLAEAVAKSNSTLGRELISTTLIAMAGLAIVICVMLAIIIQTQDIYALLNVSRELVPNLRLVAQLLCITVCLTFVAKTIGSIFLALQLPAVNNLMSSIASTLTLLFIWGYSLFDIRSFLLVCLTFTVMPLLTYLLFSVYAFRYKYPELCPTVKCFRRERVRSLMNVGVKFFIGQVSGVLLMATANFVISKAISPAEVTPYQIAYRYFTMLVIVFTLISNPIWSSTTDAYTRGDIQWIRSALKKMEYIVAASFVVLAIMYLCSNWFYRMWVGDKICVEDSLSACVAVYTFILLVSMCYSNIIYGIGKMNLTVATVCLMAFIFIFIAFPITKEYGIKGLVIVQLAVTLVCALQNIVQCKLLLAGKARGIFNK